MLTEKEPLMPQDAVAEGHPAQAPAQEGAAAAGASFLAPYPSLYHPPPFRVKAAWEIIFSTTAPQAGQAVAGGSENF